MKRLTKEQMQAIAVLEEAFKICAEAAVVFHGIDNELQALRSDEHRRIVDERGCLVDMKNGDQRCLYAVNTQKSYKDSGGW